jgi:hypothetical protein
MFEMQFWNGDESTGLYPVARVLERVVSTRVRTGIAPCRATAEWQRAHYGHPSTYGLLGASFVPDSSKAFRVRIAVSEDKPWEDPPGKHSGRRPGISDPYATRGIYAAIMVPAEAERLGSGVLTFDRAIEDTYASSAMMFGWLALALVRYIEYGESVPDADRLRLLVKDAVQEATSRVELAFHPERSSSGGG